MTLTPEEQKAIEETAALWNALVNLPVEHPDDVAEMRHLVHALQDKILSRPARREIKNGR